MISLSVHLITFNNEKHIEETLQSILKQKVDFNYEIVVGDDCSTDDTLKIINQYADEFPDLIYVEKNNEQLGILENFKITLDRCKGDYVFDIAGDDIFKSEYAFQKMVDVLKNNSSLGFVDSGFDKLYEESNRRIIFSNKKALKSSKDLYKKMVQLGLIAPIGICFRRKHLYQFVDFETYLKQKITIDDYPILVDLVMNTDFAFINESLHIYRVHDNSYSHKKSFENHVLLKNQMKNLFEYFSIKYRFDKNLIRTFNKNYFKELLFLCGYFENKELGKDAFDKIKTKSIKDYIHYFASQNSFIRKLISIL
ncbi:glycosyltransferase family 2 protein [Yeosuana marina]|uniref:glycosyltransferase family 2 protein n=1 Tax=Yeosuana marina TaxID=1565536 RepID=UPI0030EC3257|tara:strand:- start:1799 stop:2728 length:930 start_codon:yes stop_codon:yes gene_type:complete